jgi:enterobactin synthetase component F
MRRAEHRTFAGELVFFTAAAPRAEDWLTREAWAPYVAGPIRNTDLACTHPELVHPAQAARIAAGLAGATV